MQVVRSSKTQDGCEIDVRYSLYLTNYEMKVLSDLFGLVFGPPDYPRDGLDVLDIKSKFPDNSQLVGYRMFNSIFRSL